MITAPSKGWLATHRYEDGSEDVIDVAVMTYKDGSFAVSIEREHSNEPGPHIRSEVQFAEVIDALWKAAEQAGFDMDGLRDMTNPRRGKTAPNGIRHENEE